MSAQFGRWNFEGQLPTPGYIEKVSAALVSCGPDSSESYSKGGIWIIYRAFHTTKESHRETQPHICISGAVITWDGRLDNRAELVSELRNGLTPDSTDLAIVGIAYENWGTNCLAKLIGDWALSIWNPIDHSLILAKDPIGTRHLYYSIDKDQIAWCTILDPLIRFARKAMTLNEEYVAGWFSYYPAAHLTPYVGIHAVPPSSYVRLGPGTHIVSKYWDFDPARTIRYRTDIQYEEQFRVVFADAVRRRLRSDRPVLAELSGGMDSSSIVCMADTVIARGAAETSRLDTISWYNDSYDDIEPDFNERPYFTKVEELRGHTGYHINTASLRDVDPQRSFQSDFGNDPFALVPSPYRGFPEFFKRYAEYMMSQGNRVVLSGIGGDEVTGGDVPTPIPEFQNLLARARFYTLALQLSAWAAKMRTARLPLLWEALRGFFVCSLIGTGTPKNMRPAFWLETAFIRRNYHALCGYPSRVKLFGSLPSFQHHIATLDVLRRTVAAFELQSDLPREIRYPYLDRDLLEFTYAIPREQIVRLGQRRSLMKRALRNIVPEQLLNRRRKAFIPPESRAHSTTEWPSLVDVGEYPTSSAMGVTDPSLFLQILQNVRHNVEWADEVPIDSLKSTLILESWLRHLLIQGVLTTNTSWEKGHYPSSLKAAEPRSHA